MNKESWVSKKYIQNCICGKTQNKFKEARLFGVDDMMPEGSEVVDIRNDISLPQQAR